MAVESDDPLELAQALADAAIKDAYEMSTYADQIKKAEFSSDMVNKLDSTSTMLRTHYDTLMDMVSNKDVDRAVYDETS